jgi:hypothetical protein
MTNLAGLMALWASHAGMAQQARPVAPAKAISAPPSAATVAPAPVPAPAPASPLAAEPAPALVTGFRSARFGASEAEVLAAIATDFGIRKEAVRIEENAAELTRVLVVTVPDLLEGGGKADIGYVLGYRTKSLIQVGITWSRTTDETMTPERLFSNANVLRAHFLQSGFAADTIVTNAVVSGGLLIFRGTDAGGHTTAMMLQGTLQQGEANQRILTPTGLLVYYIADSKAPDVFKLRPGSF